VTKPFSPRELVARIRAVLRRFSTTAESSSASSVLMGRSMDGHRHPPLQPGQEVPEEGVKHSPATGGRRGIESAPADLGGGGQSGSSRRTQLLQHRRLQLDLDRCVAFWEGREVVLTATELGILRTLLRFPGKVFNRDELMDSIYEGEVVVSDRTIDSHIRRVRRKFEPLGGDPIQTLHGMGYRLSEC